MPSRAVDFLRFEDDVVVGCVGGSAHPREVLLVERAPDPELEPTDRDQLEELRVELGVLRELRVDVRAKRLARSLESLGVDRGRELFEPCEEIAAVGVEALAGLQDERRGRRGWRRVRRPPRRGRPARTRRGARRSVRTTRARRSRETIETANRTRSMTAGPLVAPSKSVRPRPRSVTAYCSMCASPWRLTDGARTSSSENTSHTAAANSRQMKRK